MLPNVNGTREKGTTKISLTFYVNLYHDLLPNSKREKYVATTHKVDSQS